MLKYGRKWDLRGFLVFGLFGGGGVMEGVGVTGLNPRSRGWERTGPHTHYPRIQFFEIGKPMS